MGFNLHPSERLKTEYSSIQAATAGDEQSGWKRQYTSWHHANAHIMHNTVGSLQFT